MADTQMSEIDQNILALRWMEEDYGQLVDVAIDSIVDAIEKLKDTNPTIALTLSRTFINEPFWERTKAAAYENYLVLQNEE